MPIKDRFRRAIGRSSRSSTSSSLESGTPIPSVPQSGSITPVPTSMSSSPPLSIMLTKTTSRLSLSKSLTWRTAKLTPEEKEQKRIDRWRKIDEAAWTAPNARHSRHKSKAHQDILRTFELKFKDGRGSFDGERPGSTFSGVSPGQSRVNSVDGGLPPGRKRSSGGVGLGPLSREVSRTDPFPPHNMTAALED